MESRPGSFQSPLAEPLEPRVLLSASAAHVDPVSCVFDPPAWADQSPLGEPGEPAGDAMSHPLSDTFALHSNAGATKVIYLDFNGHFTTGTDWNIGRDNGPLVTPPFNTEGNGVFSDNELSQMQDIWHRVAEDFLPFDVDVTTEDPGASALIKSGHSDEHWGVRVAIGGDSGDWYGSPAGGVAYVGSFNSDADTPVFVFSEVFSGNVTKRIAEASSHEAGHALGLEHDGSSTLEYYNGYGYGATGWAPIMGLSYYKDLTQWSKGEYPDANETQDDLAIIVSSNGFSYRSDDHSDVLGPPTPLLIDEHTVVFAEGIIERNTDRDIFEFTVYESVLVLTISPASLGANLDIQAVVYDDTGAEVASSNPRDLLNAEFNLHLDAGTYILAINGTRRDAPDTGYTDYGSLGYYSISGTLIAASATEVAARHLFYNSSSMDGDNPSANAQDDDAIAWGISALLDGQTGPSGCVSAYSSGINGIMVDFDGRIGTLTIDDFDFAVGNTADPAGWSSAPNPQSITVRPGEGIDGSDRVTIIWSDGAIRNKWLQVTVKATEQTFMDSDDVFYFASLVGDATGNGIVDLDDFVVLKQFYGQAASSPEFGNFNLDQQVDMDDFVALKRKFLSTLSPLTTPAPAAASIDLLAIADSTGVAEAAPGIVAPTPSLRLHRHRRPVSRARTPRPLPAAWAEPRCDVLAQTQWVAIPDRA